MIPNFINSSNKIIGEFLVVARAREGWGKGNIFFCGAFRKAKYEIRRRRKARAGKNSFPPTPFLFARPSENYQKSASGFSLKKVRILFRTDSQLVKFWFPAPLGASPLASANEFSSNFQTSQSFLSPEGRTQSGNFLPKSDYKFNQIKL
jgi:hypothetical protein